jgi:hypothetical protein
MTPEVLIYLQNIRNHFNTDDEIRDYFLQGIDEDIFFQYLSEISQKNYEKTGDAMLDISQFELLRTTISQLRKKILNDVLFVEIPTFGKYCLN